MLYAMSPVMESYGSSSADSVSVEPGIAVGAALRPDSVHAAISNTAMARAKPHRTNLPMSRL